VEGGNGLLLRRSGEVREAKDPEVSFESIRCKIGAGEENERGVGVGVEGVNEFFSEFRYFGVLREGAIREEGEKDRIGYIEAAIGFAGCEYGGEVIDEFKSVDRVDAGVSIDLRPDERAVGVEFKEEGVSVWFDLVGSAGDVEEEIKGVDLDIGGDLGFVATIGVVGE